MLGFLLINIYALLVIVSTTIVFFSKNRLKQVEDETYKKFLIANIFMSISGLILGLIVTPNLQFNPSVVGIFNKIYLIGLVSWIFIMTFYTVYISMKNKNKVKKYKKTFDLLALISVLIIILTPIEVKVTSDNAVASGFAVIYTYSVFALGFIVQIFMVLKNYKDFTNKKYIPLYLLILLGTLVVIVLIAMPELNYIINPAFIFIAFIMYHTIENPDVKMLDELYNAKKITDNSNEEKTMFLYNMTNDIRQIAKDIDSSNNEIEKEINNKKIDKDLVNEYIKDIRDNIMKFSTMTNEILDISQVDINNIKVYNDKYNLKIIIKELIQIYKKKCDSKEIEFRSNIDTDIPEYLYGDGVSLKKVLTTILDNSINYTDRGFIEFSVSQIMKKDISRLVITIEDSGKGINATELNKIFNVSSNENEDKYDLDNNLYNSKKLITIMGGTIIPSSVESVGTKMKIVLDQRIADDEKVIDKYEESIEKKRVLLVDDSEASVKIISKLLNDTNVDLEVVMSGKEALDKIRDKEKYDLILLDEEMEPLDGITVMKKFGEVRTFNTDVILLTKNNNYEYNDDYLKYGFKDYLLKPIDKDKLFKVINEKR